MHLYTPTEIHWWKFYEVEESTAHDYIWW
jgi:hypothetical protein